MGNQNKKIKTEKKKAFFVGMNIVKSEDEKDAIALDR